MDKPTLKQIHEAVKQLRIAIEKMTDSDKVFIGYTIIERNNVSSDNMASGIALSDNIESSDLADSIFRISGRAYEMVVWKEEK